MKREELAGHGQAAHAWLMMVAVGLVFTFGLTSVAVADTLPGGSLDPTSIPKYQDPLVIPPAMPRTSVIWKGGQAIDYYEIAMKQLTQYILPAEMGLPTTVWGYGSMLDPRPVAKGGTLNYPGLTIEATYRRPVRVKWINGLVDKNGNYLPHLLPVDQTVHWANPGAGPRNTDSRGNDPAPYTGPVPIVTHVHGAHATQESDGYPEAWVLPNAKNIPAGFATKGSYYDHFRQMFESRWGQKWTPGSMVFQYNNDQRVATLWYHDHALGMTRLNVYAGPAGFFLLRGGPSDSVAPLLPRPAPQRGDPAGKKYYEIPIAIQDRSFNEDGSLFYPDNRAFFEGLEVGQLQIPFIPASDISPIWNPEFFGNTIVVNGKTWPFLNVEQRRYRFRFLNGSQSRFLILKMSNGMPFWQIGTEGGFLPKRVKLTQLLLGPAERADVIVDFHGIPAGTKLVLQNLGPDEPFNGETDSEPANPGTTGQVMQFRVKPRTSFDLTLPPVILPLPDFQGLPAATNTEHVSLNEMMSATVTATLDDAGNVVFDPAGEAFGPQAAMLGTFDPATSTPTPLMWSEPITENPALGATEIWELHNFTADAHPIHIHEVMFQVVNREVVDASSPRFLALGEGGIIQPEAWETGYKDTVIAYPGEITRIKARFDLPGLYVWHCHILEHEDNEMMRPYRVGPAPTP